MADADAPVRCMYLPLTGYGLLVPSASVAEVVGLQAAEEVEGPPWLRGLVGWRGVKIPLMSVETALGVEQAAPGVRNRVAVMHVLGEHPHLSFYGLTIQRLPTVVLATERNARAASAGIDADWLRGQVDLEVGPGLVPHLESVEAMLEDALSALASEPA